MLPVGLVKRLLHHQRIFCVRQIPYFNAPIYLENKNDVGKVFT